MSRHRLFLFGCMCAVPTTQTTFAQPPAPSAYVQRMMSLDVNKDGFLTRSELPGSLVELIRKHDADADGQLTAAELGQLETAAINSRAAMRSRTRGETGLGRRRIAANGSGSPLDYQQIMRFALRFDRDSDGGLNRHELEEYARALAVRRAAARRGIRDNSREPSEPAPPKGLDEDDATGDSDPFGR